MKRMKKLLTAAAMLIAGLGTVLATTVPAQAFSQPDPHYYNPTNQEFGYPSNPTLTYNNPNVTERSNPFIYIDCKSLSTGALKTFTVPRWDYAAWNTPSGYYMCNTQQSIRVAAMLTGTNQGR